jgi:transposase
LLNLGKTPKKQPKPSRKRHKPSASTVFNQVELVCNDIYSVYQTLFNLSENAVYYYIDGTTNRILNSKPIEKVVRNINKTQLRSGVIHPLL